MLDIKFVREKVDVVKKSLEKRKDLDKIKLVDDVLKKDESWRKLKLQVDELKHQRNVLSLKINELKKQKKDAAKEIKEAKDIPEKISQAEKTMGGLSAEIKDALMRIPNILHESVPYGKDETENVEIKKWGKIPKFGFELKSHGELAESLGVADFKRAAKVSGSGFVYVKGALAMLDHALMSYAIEFLMGKGFTLVEPPLLLGRKAYEGVTDLADFENVMYKIDNEELYLIATSEHPLVSMHIGEVFEEDELPIKYVGASPCFRREIGGHGVDTKGLFRMHQFNKVEQVVFCLPEDSWKFHEEIQKNSEEMYQALKIPYRVVNICTGDIGIVAAKKYDIEAWYPRENKYKEVGSASNCTAYQATRLNVRYQKGNQREYVHTLNNTGIATSRVMRAILENYQQQDGSVKIPSVLWPFTNGIREITPPK